MHDYGEHHHHEHTPADEAAETKALLTYMLEHNEHHAEELAEIADRLLEQDKNEAAALIAEAIADFRKGNAKLEAALEKTGE